MENKETNKGVWIFVSIVVIILVMLAFSAGQNSNNQIQPTNTPTTTNTEKQTAPVATTNQNTNQPTTNTINNDNERACTQATILWQKQGNGCINCSYVSHYNSSQGKCFVLSTGGVVSATTSFNLVLWDIYNGIKVAQYISLGGYNYQGCNINNAHIAGCTYIQFAPFLNSEMETNIY